MVIVLWTLGITIALSETEAKAPGNKCPDFELDLMLEESERAFAAVKDRLAEEQYEKKGAILLLPCIRCKKCVNKQIFVVINVDNSA